MRLLTLLREAEINVPLQLSDREIEGISCDSRTVKAGELFVALRGLHYDGHGFVWQALQRGAVFVISEQPLEGDHILVVDNARATLAKLWDAWYGHPGRSLSLIGITGTNGKTSTATMLHWILEQNGMRAGLIGTVECKCGKEKLIAKNPLHLANMTTPDPAELFGLLAKMRDMGARYVVMEVTSHALTFEKVAPLSFERAVFTNLTPDHMDLHGDMEAYFAEKRKLFSKSRVAVISCFSSYGTRLCNLLEIPFFEISGETVRDIEKKGAVGVEFSVQAPSGEWGRISISVPGEFSVENAALAATTALTLGCSFQGVQSALNAFPGVRGRMERIDFDGSDITVFLDYAHTPDALEKLLKTVRDFATPGQQILLLFGCGGDRDRSKRREMGRIGSRFADLLVLTSDNARSEEPRAILEDILRGVDKEKPFVVINDRREAIAYAVEHARAGDILLLAGKGHEDYEIKGQQRLPFSERDIVLECLKARRERHAY